MQIGLMETERCILRRFTIEDVDEAHMAFDIHPSVYRFDPGYMRSIEERKLLIENKIVEYSSSNGLGGLAIVEKNTGTLIGNCGIHGCLSELEKYEPGPFERSLEIELYYKLRFDYWGKGYATEACKRALIYAFSDLKVRRIITKTSSENIESINLLSRLNMKMTKTDKTNEVIGALYNTILK